MAGTTRIPTCLLGALLLAGALCLGSAAASAELPSPEEAQQRWLQRLDGRHFTATLRQRLEEGHRRLTVRRDDSEGAERLLLRHEQPTSIAGSSWLLLERPGSEPALHYYSTRDRDRAPRTIPSLRGRNPLEGADPHLLGLRAAWPAPAAESIEETRLDGKRVLLLTERGGEGAAFQRRRTWIDPETWLALRLEQQRGDATVLTGEVKEVREIDGVATPMRVHFEQPDGKTIRYTYETMDYRRAIRASYFELPDRY